MKSYLVKLSAFWNSLPDARGFKYEFGTEIESLETLGARIVKLEKELNTLISIRQTAIAQLADSVALRAKRDWTPTERAQARETANSAE